MSGFWHNVLATFWHAEVPYVLSFAALLGLATWSALAAERRLVANTLGFFSLCVTGQFLAAVMQAMGSTDGGATFFELCLLGAGLALIRVAGLFVFRAVLPRLGLMTPRILEDILVILAYLAWAMVRLRYAGVELSGILATSAVITAVLAFAMQDTLGNILGGLALQLDNSIGIGEWVRLDDLTGRVTDIRWRYTAVETRNGETVIIPNSQLMKNKFVVIGSRSRGGEKWRRWIFFHVDYEVPPGRVIDLAELACAGAEIANVAAEPAPSCVLMEFAAGCGRYALRYWLIDPLADDVTDSRVRIHVFAALQRAGIRPAIPEQSLHVVKEGERRRAALHLEEVNRRSRALHDVELFASLTDDEVKSLAERMVYAPFARGDVITRQGAVAHWLYLLVSGEAEVWLEFDGQPRHLLNVLSAGSVFGERGMLTGEPRRATVTARNDVVCYRLDKAGFQTIIQSRPEIAEALSHVLVEHEAAFVDAMKSFTERRSVPDGAHNRDSVLEKIRSFFCLH